MTESTATDDQQQAGTMVTIDVLAAVIDALPGKTVDVHTDLTRVWGRELVTEELGGETMRITLKERA